MRRLVYTGLFFGLVAALASSTYAYAQIPGFLGSVDILLSPEYPQPGQSVQATVFSQDEDVRAATIVWLLDNEIQQGAESDVFNFTAGELGVPQVIGVLVKTASGKVLTKTVTLQPAQVTLLWESDAYTPPFYRGRTLYAPGSMIRAEAVPGFVDAEGNSEDPSRLMYTWSKNGTVLGDVSGINARTIVTEGPKFYGDYILSVEVTTTDNRQTARSAARVETNEPRIALYEFSPVTGIQYHASVNEGYDFSESSQREVRVEPYFMNVLSPNDDVLNYSWYVNGTKVATRQEQPASLILKLSEEDTLTASLRVVVEHTLYLLQTGIGNFDISLEGTARNSLFGF